MEKQWKQWQTLFFFGLQNPFLGSFSHEIKRHLLLGRKAMTNLDSILKQRHHFANKGSFSQSYGFSSSYVWMWELDHKKCWVPKNWCFWTVVFEKTLESLFNRKEIKPVNPKGNQSWLFIGRTEAEAPILWPPDVKNWLTGKDPDTGKEKRQEKKGDHRGWDGWIALLTWWTWVWTSPGNWWWTGKPDTLQAMGLQSQTELSDWTDWHFN